MIPPTFMQMPKPPLHRSSHSGQIPPTASTFHQVHTSHPLVSNLDGNFSTKVVRDKSHSTFGLRHGSYGNDATNFMKKMSKSCSVPSLAEVKKSNPDLLVPKTLHSSSKKGGPPKRGDVKPVMNLVTSKNFIVANAVETILSAPKKTSVEVKDYLKKEDYGKVPRYLTQVKNDIDAEYEYIRQLEQQRMDEEASSIRGIDDEERLALIAGLKQKWEQQNTEYQRETHKLKIESMGEIKRKEKNEALLQLYEKDIEKLSKRGLAVDMNA